MNYYNNKKSVRDIAVNGKIVFLRCDFNVPIDNLGKITDSKRIDESFKTINYLLKWRKAYFMLSFRKTKRNSESKTFTISGCGIYI